MDRERLDDIKFGAMDYESATSDIAPEVIDPAESGTQRAVVQFSCRLPTGAFAIALKGDDMGRAESKVKQVHPDNEQSTIEFMQIFHWNLIGSQHVKTKSSHFEERGNDVYSVVETEHYVNLTFSRETDGQNIGRIRALEAEYGAISSQFPSIPVEAGYVGPLLVCFVLSIVPGLGIIVGLIWIPKIKARNKQIRADMPAILALRESIRKRKSDIIEECRSIPSQSPSTDAATDTVRPSYAGDDVAFWDGIDKSDVEELQEYLLRFPNGRFAELAKAKLARRGSAPL